MKSAAFKDIREQGVLIHALGDAYAHSYRNPFTGKEHLYGPGIGHALMGHLPDYIAHNPAKYGQYVGQLYGVLVEIRPTNGAQAPQGIDGIAAAAVSIPKPYPADYFSSKHQDGIEENTIQKLAGNQAVDFPDFPNRKEGELPPGVGSETELQTLFDDVLNKIKVSGGSKCCLPK